MLAETIAVRHSSSHHGAICNTFVLPARKQELSKLAIIQSDIARYIHTKLGSYAQLFEHDIDAQKQLAANCRPYFVMAVCHHKTSVDWHKVHF